MPLFRHALRQLVLSPGHSLVSITLLAVGIGATSAIFTVVNSVLLRPIHFPDSERLVVIRQSLLPEFPSLSVCPADYLDFQARTDAFESMYASRGDSLILTGHAEPTRVRALRATADIFSTLRVAPDRGRVFSSDEDAPGAPRVVVLQHDFWQTQLGGRSDVLGRSLVLNGQPTTVIGIMPESFRTSPAHDLIVPMAFTTAEVEERGMHHVHVVARLATSARLEKANEQLAAIAEQLAQEYPTDNAGWGAFALPLRTWATRDVGPTLYTLLAAVGFLLLIACANVGNLVLVRATGRHQEISLRCALGASRWQVMRMLLAENLVLGLIGGAAGLLLAHWGLDALIALGGEHIPRADEVELDHRVVLFAIGLSLLTGLVFGLAPARRTHASNLFNALKSGRRGTDDDLRHHSIRQSLIVLEIALALTLLHAGGVFGRSFFRLVGTHPGFNAERTWWASLEVPPERYDTPAKQSAFARELEDRLQALPNVSSVGFASFLPFTRSNQVMRVNFPERASISNHDDTAYYFSAGANYFQTMQIPIVAGRGFEASDDADHPRVAVISESFARRFFPGIDPLGQRVNITTTPDTEWRIVVGVAADVKQFGLGQAESVQIYECFAQLPGPRMAFVVRATDAGIGLAKRIRETVQTVDPDQPVFSIRPVQDLIADSVARERFALVILLTFSVLALLLASFGVYGLIAYTVAARTREIGVRMALGASPAQVLRVVFRRGLRLIAWGLLTGMVGALAVGRLLASQLHATSSHDPFVLAGVAALLGLVSVLACLLPARQATRVDPMIAIRTE